MNTVEQMAHALRLAQVALDSGPFTSDTARSALDDIHNALANYQTAKEREAQDERCMVHGERTTYQGWPNYETWATALVFDNEEMIQRRNQQIATSYNETYAAEEAMKVAFERDMEELENALDSGVKAEVRKYAVGKYAKARIDYLTLLGKQLMQCGTDGINWRKMVEHYRGN